MNTKDVCFSIHSTEERYPDDAETENPDTKYNYITFCPSEYWTEHKCLPDYYFSDDLEDAIGDDFPEGYFWYLYSEETTWYTKKSREEILEDLTKMGFVLNLDLEKFLTDCWS